MAGIPLIGISLHAAIAAVETMLQYGMLEAWDSHTRAIENHEAEWRQLALRRGEQVQLEQYGSYHETQGIWHVSVSRPSPLTHQRLLLIRPLPQEILFAVEVSAIAGIGRVPRENVATTAATSPAWHWRTEHWPRAAHRRRWMSGGACLTGRGRTRPHHKGALHG